ncbi:MAG: alpha/beta hydrolase [Gammaproteobacteria bacterium]|nr:alpha/beta hydrolase [Gammaproteobacteria bacterium]
MGELELTNKSRLAWSEYGATDGEPVLYFHGAPGSRLEAQPADKIAKALKLRLISIDRPGYGDSTLQDDFNLLDWPGVISQLADKLNLERFSILGFSCGGIYALACAHEMPEKINHLTLVSCPAPFETQAMQEYISVDFKPFYELSVADKIAAAQQFSQLAPSAEALFNILHAPLPACDKAIFSQNSMHTHYLENLTEAIKNGSDGLVNDLRNMALPWQFNPGDIPLTVNIWHGENDLNFGVGIGKYLADTLENSSPQFLDNNGHYLLFEHWREILECFRTSS